MKRILVMLILSPLALIGGLIQDQTGWITGLSGDDASGSTSYSGTGTGSKWNANATLSVDAGEFPKAGYWYLHTNKRLRTPNKADQAYTFAGARLALDGGEFSHQTANTRGVVQVDDFWLCSGKITTWSTVQPKIAGKMTVYSPESKPVAIQMRGRNADGNYGMLEVASKICGDTTYLPQDEELMLSLVYSPSGNETFPPCAVRFSGDCSEYGGVIKVGTDVVFEVGNATTTDFPAEVRLQSNSSLTALPGTTTKFRKVALAESGVAEIVFPYDAEQGFGSIELDDLSIADGGKVRVVVTGAWSSARPYLNKAILTLPTDPTDRVEFDISSFTNETGAVAGKLAVVPVEGGYSLKLTTYITLTTGDVSATTAIDDADLAINKDENWSPRTKPQTGYDYLVPDGLILRMPKNSLSKFPGDSLTVAGTVAAGYSDFDMGELRFVGGTSKTPLFFTNSSGKWSLTGRVEVAVKEGYELLVENYGGSVHTFDCEFHGSGDMRLKGHNNSQSAAGRALFSGDNTGFKGRLYVTMQNTKGGSSPNYRYFPQMEDGYSTELSFNEEKNLGGALDEFRYDALKIDQMAILHPATNVTFSAASNRGILVGGGTDSTNRIARFRVDEGLTMTVMTPITYNGILHKEGAGTLALGGRALFADGREDTAPVAGNDGLVVSEGKLKVVSSTALDGVSIAFEADSEGLVIDWNAADDVRQLGLLDAKSSTPLATHRADGKIPVAFVGATKGDMGTTAERGICTVKSELAEQVRNLLAVAKPVAGYKPVIVPIDNKDGTTTLKAVFEQQGIVLIVR